MRLLSKVVPNSLSALSEVMKRVTLEDIDHGCVCSEGLFIEAVATLNVITYSNLLLDFGSEIFRNHDVCVQEAS
jgi:hypothetical protein